MTLTRALVAATVVGITIGGCATMHVSSHVEPGITFARYHTFDWGPADALPTGDPRLDNNPFFRDYLQGAVERHLLTRGIGLALPGEIPDLLVHYHASVTRRLDVAAVDGDLGYADGRNPQVLAYDEGTIVLDLVDARTGRLVWRGWAQDSLSGLIDTQARLERKIEEAVTKMIARLPAL